ncbi:hypothetical protein ACM01_39550 [Streptomyces viridochromogenes]|uniref:Uncharacterized protein n=1 Tax=Streptomyces viridochromogenes TaxID=1938 RepID=A0A0J8BRM9_STRVR|nr:hypothetical protein ACM01_39550 [Streptomyces viridochromogenes]KOG08793.1 hypothetical protein ADK35_41070 [Streptomyces viridochromogenes]KOG09135.1 hypothetical protein ADK36_41805 [Streptomyces viridochromogenes]
MLLPVDFLGRRFVRDLGRPFHQGEGEGPAVDDDDQRVYGFPMDEIGPGLHPMVAVLGFGQERVHDPQSAVDQRT